jgi:hypothetical protein
LWAAASSPAEQLGPPVRLLPPPAPGVTPAVPPPSAAPQPTPAAATDRGITTTPLGQPDIAWQGTLGEGEHRLPPTMWRGTPRALVAVALAQLGPNSSPTLQALTRRLLLSNADAPAGADPPDQPGLLALRLTRLAALGEIDGAAAVLDALPQKLRDDEKLARLGVELLFARNDARAACQQAQASVAQYQGAWWARAVIACQALSGEREQAALGLSLLREQKAPPDPAFDALVAAEAGHPAKLERLPQTSPILLTLLAAAKLPLPDAAVATADLMSLRGWATNELVPAAQRLLAAERAASLGALTPQALGELYAKVEFKPEELGAAIRRGKLPGSARERALLYQLARTDPASTVRATALKALLAEARARGDFITMARVVAPLLVDLPPSDDLAPFAPDAARALIAAGESSIALRWQTILLHADPSQFARIGVILDLASAPRGEAAASEGAPSDARLTTPQKTVLLALETGLGKPVDASDWAPLLAPPHSGAMPSPAVWLDQQRAATDRRMGETVLMTLLLAHDGERLTQEPAVLAGVVSSLALVDRESEARGIAVEAALDAGL